MLEMGYLPPVGNPHNGSFDQLPFDNRPASTAGPLRRAGSNMSRQESGLIRFGSGDQYVMNQHGHIVNQMGQGMTRQVSSPGQIGTQMPLHASGMPWQQQWAPALSASDAAPDSLVIHGPHSLLEQPRPGMLCCIKAVFFMMPVIRCA